MCNGISLCSWIGIIVMFIQSCPLGVLSLICRLGVVSGMMRTSSRSCCFSAPFFAYNSSLLMTFVSDNFMWNISKAKICTPTFCALFESCRFKTSAASRHYPRMRLGRDCDFGNLCAKSSRVYELTEHLGIFCLLVCSFLDTTVVYLAVRQMLTVD